MEATIPRDSSGIYSLPPGYLAVTGQTVLASQHNPPLEDLATAITGSLPRSGSTPMLGPINMNGSKITNVADGTADSDGVNKAQLDAAVPSGTVVDFAGSVAPAGWLLCYGQAVSRATYQALYSRIGTAYGAGDGSTTFNVPDCRGRVGVGRDNMGGTSAARMAAYGAAKTLGGTLGADLVALTIAQLPSHNHGGATTTDGSHTHEYTRAAATGTRFSGGGDTILDRTEQASSGISGSHFHAIPSEGGGAGHPNAQPSIVFNKIIKT